MDATVELKFSKFLAFGLFIITTLVLAGPVTDPVNVTKHLALGAVAFALVPFLILNRKYLANKENRLILWASSAFVIFAFLSVLFSESPIQQNLYGTFGRNTGFITFFSFVIVFLAVSLLRNKLSLNYVIFAFGSAGAINVLYSIVYKLIGDPLPWNNIYKAFLGTFGNPNFSGAFCGIIVAIYSTLFLSNKRNLKLQTLFAFLTLGSFFAVWTSKTTQGILVAGISLATVVYIYIAKSIKVKVLSFTYLAAVFTIGSLSILGMLQIGPLARYLYKETVSLRGSYWSAAINAGNENLLTGIGLDALGDWYRRARSLKAATWLPGPEVITNAAHNYYLDIYASGGVLLLIAYIAITLIGVHASYKLFKHTDSFDYVAAILISTFLGFQAQAIISIPQIGVAVWGWVIIGMLFSYSKILEVVKNPSKSIKVQRIHSDTPIGILIFVGMSIGILISIPPFSADAKWMNATKSQKLNNVEAALIPNYFNPSNSNKYANAVLLMENNKFYEEAHKYALKAVEFNPEFFEAWRGLYFVTNSTIAERKLALENMKRLDPLNKRLAKLK